VKHDPLAVFFTVVVMSALTLGAEVMPVRAKPLQRLKVSENIQARALNAPSEGFGSDCVLVLDEVSKSFVAPRTPTRQ